MSVELTGNAFVDNGLAALATLSNCKTIDQLTLRKMKNVHKDGTKLARANSRLRSFIDIFTINSIITNPSFKDKEKCKRDYAKITTAMLNNIGNEDNENMCEMCGNSRSMDLDKIVRKVVKEGEKRDIGRDWFPLAGSIVNDAQSLPSGSRSLSVCATCMFAVQYLPQSVIKNRGMLTIFQSTSTTFWYKLVKSVVNEMTSKLSTKTKGDKIDTLGSGKEGGGMIAIVNEMINLMEKMKLEPGTSLITWEFVNGKKANYDTNEIPNYALVFLDKARQLGLRDEINTLIHKDKNLLYHIINRHDYLSLYPSKRHENDGVSPEFFLLYQTHIRNYNPSLLHTAFKIADYVLKNKIDNRKHKDFGIDIDKSQDGGQRTRVKQWIVDMVQEGRITFDEYYDLFVTNDKNPWTLIKYYLLKPNVSFEKKQYTISNINTEHKKALQEIGTILYNSLIERKGEDRFKKEVLDRFAANKIGENWLRKQFEILHEQGEFDYTDNWNKLVRDDNIYEALYLLRLLFTTLFLSIN